MAHIDPSTPYCFVPEYTLRTIAQRICIAFEHQPEVIGTDQLAPNIDEAEDFCDKLNRPHDIAPDRSIEIAAAYIDTVNGAPILLKPADFEHLDKAAMREGVKEIIPLWQDIAKAVDPDGDDASMSREMVSQTATMFDRLLAETDDQLVYQRRHLAELTRFPHAWDTIDFRQWRAGELVRHFEAVREHIHDVLTELCNQYKAMTGTEITFAPYFPPPPPIQSRFPP